MKARRDWLWLGLGAAAFGLQAWLGRDSALVERIYSRGVFVVYRWAWDYTLGLAPIACLYIAAAGLAAVFGFRLARFFGRPRSGRKTAFLKRTGRVLLAAAGWAGRLVFFFYALWGFNYGRLGLSRQMGLEPSPLTVAELEREAAWTAAMSAEARAAIPGASREILPAAVLPADMESVLRKSMATILRQAGYPAPGRVRVRAFVPGGWMMSFSSTGVYIPYFGEGYAAGNLLPYEKPFTMAHEMAHGFGITDEGEAGFLGFLACRSSSAAAIRYSGWAGYWEFAAGELSRPAPAALKESWDSLHEGMRADIRAAQANAARYRGAVERVSRKVYAEYLRSQGIDDGLRSYSRLVGLVAAWRKKHG
jgi:hypothetical protein